ncbi:MAG: HyaD/HybD family hydrogenase maturation endopeptidase [Acidobacteria bacterium]|nr:HyaD/HybD family hydrogenase maturation endopeptidase [Acidobacteriota bacterium]
MISVLGLGNVLMGDDGLGPVAVRTFEAEYIVPPDVQVIDLGTPGLDLLPWLADVDQVILVDTVKTDLPPGTVRLYEKADLLRYPPTARVGPHDPGVKEALHALEFAGRAPREVVLIGIVPESTAMSLELTPTIKAAVPRAVLAIEVTLARFGTPVMRRTHPRPIASALFPSLARSRG